MNVVVYTCYGQVACWHHTKKDALRWIGEREGYLLKRSSRYTTYDKKGYVLIGKCLPQTNPAPYGYKILPAKHKRNNWPTS